jgi:Ni,Fe-hydrogenase III small subunit
LRLDSGKCVFCRACEKECHREAIGFTREWRLSAGKREDLVVSDKGNIHPALLERAAKVFGRSLRLRQVSAGGCNACEADVNVLGTPAWDMGRFGIQFVASPRHADGLLITGPVTKNMRLALLKTYEAIPSPKVVFAVGACAISGGIFKDHPQTHNGAAGILPVDLFIPGCPPHPLTTLDGLLRFLGRIPDPL